jgi:hypothetical protein
MKILQLFLEDIQYAYAYAIINITAHWVHDEDGANNYCATGVEQIKVINNNIIVKYTPVGKDVVDWYDDALITIEATPESERVLTKSIFTKIKPMLEFVEDKFLESVNGTLQKAGVWIEDLRSREFEGILSLNKPVYWKDNKINIDYNILNFMHAKCRHWTPKELVEWFYTCPSHIRRKTPKIESIKLEYKEQIEMLKDFIEKAPTETLKNELVSIESHVEYLIEGVMYKYGYPASYTSHDDEMESWKRDYQESIESISLKEAFPNRFVSGKKRTLNK